MNEGERGRSALEEHDQTSDQVGNPGVLDDDREEEDYARRRQIEQHKNEDEPPERRNLRYEPHRVIDNRAKHERGNDPQRNHIKQQLGAKVSERVVVPVCAFPGEE